MIKVARPGGGDFARHYDWRVKGLSSHFVWTNHGKESIALDLKDDEQLGWLKALISKATSFSHSSLTPTKAPNACP